jgi:carboxyl-terminal processing protease
MLFFKTPLGRVLAPALLGVGLAFPSAAQAAPAPTSLAQALFDQGTFFLGFYYNGPAQVPSFRELRRIYQPQLDQACAPNKDRCGYEQAHKVLEDIVQKLGDPFTRFVSARELEDARRYEQGLGPVAPRIGVWARETPKGLVVVESFPGEPAFEAGLRRGDLITGLAGQPATLARLEELEKLATPQSGGATKNAFLLTYSRQGTSRSVNLTARVAQETMQPRYEPLGNVAYLKVYHFYNSPQFSVAERIYEAARRAESSGAKGMILDLRDALTGYDVEALLAAGAFIPKAGFIYDRRFQGLDETVTLENGQVFSQRDGQEREPERAVPNPYQAKLPLVVLVNRYTVNSAEMLAYFLQTAGRAKVVGEPTAGALGASGDAEGPLISGDFISVSSLRMRALDQTPFPLKVTPDVLLPEDLEALSRGRDLALEKALELLK